jgi:hypothetical protein
MPYSGNILADIYYDNYNKKIEEKPKVTYCPICGLMVFEDGNTDYFMTYKIRDIYDVEEVTCLNHEE